MYILGISAYFHDSAACLLRDDFIVAAAQEERFSRIKNDDGFPFSAVRYCLNTAKVSLRDVDYIVFYEKPFLKFERILETHFAFAPRSYRSFVKGMPLWLKEKLFLKRGLLRSLVLIDEGCHMKEIRLLFSSHHLSHAASAYFPSPFDKAVIITADGVGEWTTTSVSIGTGKNIRLLKEIRFPHSIGLLYSAFTYYLGFRVNYDEYKVMGLAPYGKPIYEELIRNNLVDIKEDGSFRLNLKYFNYCTGLTMTSSAFDHLFGRRRRDPFEDISEFHMDIAASIQAVVEEILLKITQNAYASYHIENLCLAGGVALNCVSNGKILRESGFKNIWIQPAAGDAGGTLGAAYAVYYQYEGVSKVPSTDKMQNALLGPSFTSEEVMAALTAANQPIEKLPPELYYHSIADFIARGMVVGYFKGRLEFGPRALGARSILADPRNADMQSILNKKIKFRESFRPFAPAILEEHAAEWFNIDAASPYMLLVAGVKEEHRMVQPEQVQKYTGFKKLKVAVSDIPAVTHVDYSARIQTVNKADHPDFYNLIDAFYKITGVPMVVNTSFNRMDEPIVNTPSDAINCFLKTGIDVLIIENFIVRK